jgi:hypothetical protein
MMMAAHALYLGRTMTALFVCTGERVLRLQDGTAQPLLDRPGAYSLAVDGDRVLVGTSGRGAFLSADRGASWEPVELPERDVFSVAIGEADGALYAGTEPSRLFRSRDGVRWEELTGLQDIPSRERWRFPPRPWTHHVRWIAPDPHDAARLLVGIELGGVMWSGDGGASFTDHRPGAKWDAHNLAWHPRAPGRAYEAAGDGAAWSRDGGRTWEAADAGRDLGYCWALAADPGNPERWYVSAASGPGAAHRGRGSSGRVYRWDGDGPWTPVTEPLDAMPYALVATADRLFAGLADGRVLASADGGDSWETLGGRAGAIVAMAVG